MILHLKDSNEKNLPVIFLALNFSVVIEKLHDEIVLG